MISKKFFILVFFVSVAALYYATAVFASTTNGTITGYAWGNRIGWINFGCTNCNGSVTSSAVGGHAWAPTYGWINLSPSQSGLTNTTSGVLGGRAWGGQVGWINFSGVTINTSTGLFSGTATVDDGGSISFSCTNCNVTTDWRPGGSGGGGGGGGGGGFTVSNDSNPKILTLPIFGYPTDLSGGVVIEQGVVDELVFTSSDDAIVSDSLHATSPAADTPAQTTYAINALQCAWVSRCNTNVSCGNDGFTGQPYCQGSAVYQDYVAHTCVSPGTIGAYCFAPTTPRMLRECLDDQICDQGACNQIKPCNTNADCGQDGYAGEPFCQGSGAYRMHTTNTCHNPGTNRSYCAANATTKLLQSCAGNLACNNGGCVTREYCDTATGCDKPDSDTAGNITNAVVLLKKAIPLGKGLAAAGAVAGTIVTVAVAISPLVSLINMAKHPLHLLGLLLSFVGLRKRTRPWGVVYDATTKQPLDPAYVMLKTLDGKEVQSTITDADGRFGFLVEPGSYVLDAKKTNYVFPSKKLAGRQEDELYDNLYFGNPITITQSSQVVIENVPMDPVAFDWNEYAKKAKNFMTFYSKWDPLARLLVDMVFLGGFGIALAVFLFEPKIQNGFILAAYVTLLFLRQLGIRFKPYGFIVDGATGISLPFCIVRVMMPLSDVQIASRVADKYGRYYCLVPRGKYTVIIEKKNMDGSYTKAYSRDMDVGRKGIINARFKI